MATKMYLKMDPAIRGSVTDSGHVGEIEVLDFAWLLTPGQSSRGGRGATPAAPTAINLTKPRDAATTALMEACAQGTSFDGAVLTVEKADDGAKKQTLRLSLTGVLVSGCSVSSRGELPMDSVSLSFTTYTSAINT